mgnify:CR=1 FL=1
MPNGLCFSPDESRLYINDTPRGHIKVFDVLPDGGLANGRLFFEGIISETVAGKPALTVLEACGLRPPHLEAAHAL